MDQALKERLVGAAVLVILVVIFLPMLLSDHIKKNEEEESDLPTVELTDPIEVVPVEIESTPEAEMVELESLELESYGNEGETQTLSVDNQTEQQDNAETTETQIIPKQVETVTEPTESVKEEEKVVKALPETPEQDSSNTKPSGFDANRLREMGLTSYVVQLGTYSSKANADGLVKKLKAKEFPAFIEPIRSGDKMLYRVRVGPEVDREDASGLLQKLRQQIKMDGTVLEYP